MLDLMPVLELPMLDPLLLLLPWRPFLMVLRSLLTPLPLLLPRLPSVLLEETLTLLLEELLLELSPAWWLPL